MSLGDRIKALPRDRRSTIVDEWADGDEACVIYAAPLYVADMKWIQARHKSFLTEMQIEGMVDMIIRKCRDKGDEKLFSIEDKQTLMGSPLDVISGIYGDLWGGQDYEDVEKN